MWDENEGDGFSLWDDNGGCVLDSLKVCDPKTSDVYFRDIKAYRCDGIPFHSITDDEGEARWDISVLISC